jgi:hypothetical protein
VVNQWLKLVLHISWHPEANRVAVASLVVKQLFGYPSIHPSIHPFISILHPFAADTTIGHWLLWACRWGS